MNNSTQISLTHENSIPLCADITNFNFQKLIDAQT